MSSRHLALPLLLLIFPALLGSKCKKEEEEPDVTEPTDLTPPEVELQVISIDPARGAANESFPAKVYGAAFDPGVRVSFGETEAARVTWNDENVLDVTVPALEMGVYDVIALNPDNERAVLRRGLSISGLAVSESCRHLTVYFDFDSSDLRGEALSTLGAQAPCLQQSRGTIRVEGHTDERGTTEYNIALGERRALSVSRYLTSQGVSPSRVEVVSYGEERPADRGHGEAAWSQNRRAEITLED